MANNRVGFFAKRSYRQAGLDSANTIGATLQTARAEAAKFRDMFRDNLQDVAVNSQADDAQYRVSNIQEIGRIFSGSNYNFAHAFIVRDTVNNMEWMFIITAGIFHYTTGVYNSYNSGTISYTLNGGTASWTNNLIMYKGTHNSATDAAAEPQNSASWSAQNMWVLHNNDYATSTWGGSWEYPTIASAYTLDFIRASSFGANILVGDPASSGPNPVTAGAGNFDLWWPASFSTKNCHGYSDYNYPGSGQAASLSHPYNSYFIFDKVEKNMVMYNWFPHINYRARVVAIGEIFDSYAAGGLANASDTKKNGVLIYDIDIGGTSPTVITNSNSCRKVMGFRGDGTTRDATMIMALNGDRLGTNYKNGSDEIFTRRVNVSNGFTTKGFLKNSLIMEGGPNTTATTVTNSENAWDMLNKFLEYPDADNPMLFSGGPYITEWVKDIGSLWGLTYPPLP
jgi:hypothetical protein